MCIEGYFSFRSPPRTRRSSASSVGSNSGSLAPSLPSTAQHRNSTSTLSPAPRNSESRRSRSPTPRRTLTPNPPAADRGRNRSRSPTPNYRLSPGQARDRSPSPTPRRALTPTVASRNRSRSPTPRKPNLKTSRPSTPNQRRSRSTSPKEGFNTGRFTETYPAAHEECTATISRHGRPSTPLADYESVDSVTVPIRQDQLCGAHTDTQVCSSDDISAQSYFPGNRTVAGLVTDEVLKASLEDKRLDAANEKFDDASASTKQKVDTSPGVDCSPCFKVSDNFINHPQRSSSCVLSSFDSPRHSLTREYDSGVDTSPAQRVSDNFTNQHRVSIAVRRSPTPVKDRSGVDTTPSRRISDSLTTGKRAGKYGSANGLDTLSSTDCQANNDSGSEVSDEGYRSLGIVPTPQSTPAPGVKSLTGSLLIHLELNQ